MFFVLSKTLDVFLSPYTWGLLFAALAVPWRRRPARASRWRRRRAFGIAGLLVLMVFGSNKVSNTMLYRLERAVPSTYKADEIYDAVVLLGGVSDERVTAETGQRVYNDNVERLIATHRLLADGKARFAIVSGAALHPRFARYGEARVLTEQLADWGIDPSRVILEEQARNTHENALYVQKILAERGFTRVVVVTSAFHMRRASECFQAVGLTPDLLPVDYRAASVSSGILPRASALAESTATIREVAGLYIYRLQGYAKPY